MDRKRLVIQFNVQILAVQSVQVQATIKVLQCWSPMQMLSFRGSPRPPATHKQVSTSQKFTFKVLSAPSSLEFQRRTNSVAPMMWYLLPALFYQGAAGTSSGCLFRIDASSCRRGSAPVLHARLWLLLSSSRSRLSFVFSSLSIRPHSVHVCLPSSSPLIHALSSSCFSL